MLRLKRSTIKILCAMLITPVCFAAERAVWIKPLYYADQQYENGNLQGYLTYSGALIVGIDTALNSKDMLGVGASYFNSKQKDINNTASSVNINNYDAMLYGTNFFTPTAYLDWLASVGYNNYKSSREATSTIFATADYSGQQIVARAVFNKVYCNKELQFIPQLSANAIYLHHNSYSEQGAGIFNQSIAANNAGVFTLGAGFKATTLYARGKWQMIPELRGILFYDVFGADINALSAYLIGGPAITTSTVPGRAGGQLGASLTATLNRYFKCCLSYDLLLKASYFNNVVALQIKYII